MSSLHKKVRFFWEILNLSVLLQSLNKKNPKNDKNKDFFFLILCDIMKTCCSVLIDKARNVSKIIKEKNMLPHYCWNSFVLVLPNNVIKSGCMKKSKATKRDLRLCKKKKTNILQKYKNCSKNIYELLKRRMKTRQRKKWNYDKAMEDMDNHELWETNKWNFFF